MNNQPTQSIQDNEIDLKVLWTTFIKHKLTIITITTISTLVAVGYEITAIPIYQGNVLIEVGEVVNSQTTTISYLDNINTLKEVTIAITKTNITIPNGTSNILNISIESANKAEIKSKLHNTIQFILDRHQEKGKTYQNAETKIRMTQVIGEIQIGDAASKSKKGLIIAVGFITGLILGILMAFLSEFIANGRRINEIPEMNKE